MPQGWVTGPRTRKSSWTQGNLNQANHSSSSVSASIQRCIQESATLELLITHSNECTQQLLRSAPIYRLTTKVLGTVLANYYRR